MKRLLLASALALGLPLAANAVPTLTVTATDNAVPIVLTCAPANPSTTGGLSCGTTDPAFAVFSLTAAGVPALASPDLSSVTLDVTAAAGGHLLALDIVQTGISAPSQNIESTFTTNDLAGSPGPTTESTDINGVTLHSTTFLVGDNSDSRTFIDPSGGAITSDSHHYSIDFTAAGQSANDTIQLVGVVPEPASLTLLGVGLIGLGYIRRRRQS